MILFDLIIYAGFLFFAIFGITITEFVASKKDIVIAYEVYEMVILFAIFGDVIRIIAYAAYLLLK